MKKILWIGVNVALWLWLVGGAAFAQDDETWQPVTGPFGGSVAALAMSPAYRADHTVFAGLRGQGVYRTVNGGISWQASSPPGWIVVDLAISPAYATDRTVFALSGLSTAGFTLHRSTNSGASWQASTAPTKFPFLLRISISPNFATDHTLYLTGGVASPVYVSTDGGLTFNSAGGWFATHPVSELHFSPAYASDQTLFAVSVNDGLYKSTNGGATWALTGLSGTISTVAVSPNYAADQTLLAVEYATGQVTRSTDGGATWSATPISLGSGGQHTLRFSPTFASDNLVMAASSTGSGVYRSANRGDSWTLTGVFDPAAPFLGGIVGGAVYALAIAPDTAYDAAAFAGTSTGMYLSSNSGENWYQANRGLARLTTRAIAAAPGNADLLLAGTSFFENRRFDTATPGETDGNLHRSTDGGQSWKVVSGRLEQLQGVAFSPNFSADQTAFAIAGTIGQHGFVDGGVYRSTDGGETWQEVFSDRAFYALAVSPTFASDRTVWASAFSNAQALGIHVSTDGGQTWDPLPTVIGARSLAPSPNYAIDKTIFAGTASQGLQKSTNGGQTWSQVLPQPVTVLAVSPAYGASRTLYAGVQAETGQPDHLYRSTNGGSTWQEVETGIPGAFNGESLTIASLSFASDGSLLVGVHYGYNAGGGAVYRSVDGGQTWPLLADGLEPDNVFAVTNTPGPASLSFYAGTDGGLWRLEVAQGDPAEPGQWVTAGPRGGRGQALAVSPNFQNDGIAFTGEWLTSFRASESGLGIFKSSDVGQTWQNTLQEIVAGIPYHSALHAYAFSPNFATDRTVFAGTGGGLLKSSDAGETWEWLTGVYFGPPGAITALAVAPDYPSSSHLLAGGGLGGIFVSRDGGRSWQPDYSVAASGAIAYSPSFATDKIAFAAGGYSGLSKTNNGGLTWTGVLSPSISALAVSPAFGSDQTVWAGGEALHRSTDGGASWNSQIISPQAGNINALAISPAFSQAGGLFAGTNNGLYWSVDGGASWQAVNAYVGVRVISLAVSPGWPDHPVLLVGTARGVYRLKLNGPPGATLAGDLREPTQGLATLSTETLALTADESLLLAGASNHGIYGSDNGGTWQPRGLQEGNGYYGIGDLAISPAYATDRTLFAAWGSGVSIGGNINRSRNGGESWQNVFSAGYIGGLAMSPQYAADQTLFATADNGRVLRSTNGGDSWAELGNWPGGQSPPVFPIALPPNYPGNSAVFVGSAQGFWRLPAGGNTWQAANSGLDSSRYVRSIAVSPTYAADQTLLAIGSWAEQGGAVQRFGVYRSTDGGANWTLVNNGLPEISLHTVAYSPNYATDRTAYVSAGQGQLFRSIDGGLNWVLAHRVPDRPASFELVVDRQDQVHLATGSGVWRYSTPLRDMLIDGGFEADMVWDLPVTPRPANLSSQVVFAGQRSVQIGLAQGRNIRTYASARQIVTIPSHVTSATLNYSLYLASGETTSARQSQFSDQELALETLTSTSVAAGDAQYVLILQPDSGAILQTLFWTLSNAQSWQPQQVDLTPYAGQRIRLHFGVYNDGAAGQTAMFVDHVSLLIDRPSQAPLNFRLYLPVIRR